MFSGVTFDASKYGWSYYNYHPFGCDADGYKKAMAQDQELIGRYLEGTLRSDRIHGLFSELVNQEDIGKYKVTWSGRSARIRCQVLKM